MSAEGKSVVAPGPAAPAPSGHRAAPLSWLSSVPVSRTECVTSSFTSDLSSIALRVVLITPCTDCSKRARSNSSALALCLTSR